LKAFDFVVQLEYNGEKTRQKKPVEPTDVPRFCVPCNTSHNLQLTTGN